MNRKHNTRLFRSLRLDNILSGVLFLFAVILVAVFLRVFVFEIYSIPTGSMEETLLPGDRIVVSKLAYGAVLPRSPLEVPWLNAFFLLNRQAIAANDTFVWRYRRLPGLSRLQRGDVVVFRYPADPHIHYIKRCVALPGDTVEVRGGVLYVNGRKQPLPAEARQEYRVWSHRREALQKLCDSLHLYNALPPGRGREYRVLNLTRKEKEILLATGLADTVRRYVREGGGGAYGLVGRDEEGDTGGDALPDRYGPVVVPQRGKTMTVNEAMLHRYGTAMERYEHFAPERKDSLWVWHGRPVTHYTFRQDYYFMMGDNRHNSTDSRWWGPVPEELITGKAMRVLWSWDGKGMRWGRFFRKIE